MYRHQKPDDNCAGPSQSRPSCKTTNRNTQLQQQIQSWEVQNELVGQKLVTNDISLQQMTTCWWQFQQKQQWGGHTHGNYGNPEAVEQWGRQTWSWKQWQMQIIYKTVHIKSGVLMDSPFCGDWCWQKNLCGQYNNHRRIKYFSSLLILHVFFWRVKVISISMSILHTGKCIGYHVWYQKCLNVWNDPWNSWYGTSRRTAYSWFWCIWKSLQLLIVKAWMTKSKQTRIILTNFIKEYTMS